MEPSAFQRVLITAFFSTVQAVGLFSSIRISCSDAAFKQPGRERKLFALFVHSPE